MPVLGFMAHPPCRVACQYYSINFRVLLRLGGGATEERHEAPRLPAAIEFPGTGKHGCGFAPAEPRRLNQLYAAIRLAVGGELPPTLKCMAKSRRGDADALATWIEVVLLRSEGRQKCLMRGAGNCGRGAPRG